MSMSLTALLHDLSSFKVCARNIDSVLVGV
jgi:hypothetical protein